MFQDLIEISALPGELTISCSWHGATSARQAAASQQCAITFCALFHEFFFMYFVVV
jgi:hypothetical protein